MKIKYLQFFFSLENEHLNLSNFKLKQFGLRYREVRILKELNVEADLGIIS